MTHADDTEQTPDAADDAPTTELHATDAAPEPDPAPADAHEVEAASPPPPASSADAARRRLDGRSVAIGAVGAALVVLAFGAGMAVRDHDGDERHGSGRLEMMGGRGPQGGPPGMQPGGGQPGMSGGDQRGGGMPGPGGYGRGGGDDHGGMMGPGGRGGGFADHHGGAIGEVTKVSKSSITVDPMRGGDPVTVRLDDDTKVLLHGDGGRGDMETGSLDDIDEGATVMVHAPGAEDDDSTAVADAIIVFHASGDDEDD